MNEHLVWTLQLSWLWNRPSRYPSVGKMKKSTKSYSKQGPQAGSSNTSRRKSRKSRGDSGVRGGGNLAFPSTQTVDKQRIVDPLSVEGKGKDAIISYFPITTTTVSGLKELEGSTFRVLAVTFNVLAMSMTAQPFVAIGNFLGDTAMNADGFGSVSNTLVQFAKVMRGKAGGVLSGRFRIPNPVWQVPRGPRNVSVPCLGVGYFDHAKSVGKGIYTIHYECEIVRQSPEIMGYT